MLKNTKYIFFLIVRTYNVKFKARKLLISYQEDAIPSYVVSVGILVVCDILHIIIYHIMWLLYVNI